jgi:NADH-quinone oxidoreductase subunit M
MAPMRADIAALDARLARAKPDGDAGIWIGTAAPAAQAETAAHGGAH